MRGEERCEKGERAIGRCGRGVRTKAERAKGRKEAMMVVFRDGSAMSYRARNRSHWLCTVNGARCHCDEYSEDARRKRYRTFTLGPSQQGRSPRTDSLCEDRLLLAREQRHAIRLLTDCLALSEANPGDETGRDLNRHSRPPDSAQDDPDTRPRLERHENCQNRP